VWWRCFAPQTSFGSNGSTMNVLPPALVTTAVKRCVVIGSPLLDRPAGSAAARPPGAPHPPGSGSPGATSSPPSTGEYTAPTGPPAPTGPEPEQRRGLVPLEAILLRRGREGIAEACETGLPPLRHGAGVPVEVE